LADKRVSLSKATLFFIRNLKKGKTMPKIIIYLREQDYDALAELAQQKYRVPKAQAALIIRRELEKRGLISLSEDYETQVVEETHDTENSAS
jgi:hypothetical protein